MLDAVVIDRHFDPEREGRRTLVDLCAHYGIEIGKAHDAVADATASIEVLFALAVRYDALWECDLARLHNDQIGWHREWTRELRLVATVGGHDPDRSSRLRVAGRPGGAAGSLRSDQALSRSQTISTPSFSARTTLAGCFLSMWPTRPL